MLELNNVLMATFRFAAGQKSISADDLVVFAEIIYLTVEQDQLLKVRLLKTKGFHLIQNFLINYNFVCLELLITPAGPNVNLFSMINSLNSDKMHPY